MTFKHQLSVGAAGESIVAAYFQSLGWTIQPVYEKFEQDHKGPRIFGQRRKYVAPDAMLIRYDGTGRPRAGYIEVKTKAYWTYHGKSGKFQTGIDKHHCQEYEAVQRDTGIPVTLVFFHTSEQARFEDVKKWACPSIVDDGTGLFLSELSQIARTDDIARGHASKGMAYWNKTDLRRVAAMDQLKRAALQFNVRWPY
jgi:hypothetical protein